MVRDRQKLGICSQMRPSAWAKKTSTQPRPSKIVAQLGPGQGKKSDKNSCSAEKLIKTKIMARA
jgi:hypothetical protein